MSDSYDAFNAPKYINFDQQQEDVNGDSFFDNGNESTISGKSAEIVEVVELSDTESDAVFFSPLETSNTMNNSSTYLRTKLRRSVSMNSLPVANQIRNETDNLNTSHLEEVQRPASACSKKAASKEHINRLAQPKRYASQDNLTKFQTMTMAEALIKFQAGTPRRFRSNKISGATIAHTPNLLTKRRARPNYAISKEEQERLEVEEARKFKIRANPVSKRVLRGPLKPQVDTTKPPTQIVPFNLTEVKKREIEHLKQNKVPVFKAQPLPKSLHNPFKVQAAGQPPTKGVSPSFSQKYTKPPSPQVEIKATADTKHAKTGPTLIKPFSFEKRDRMMVKKKEEFINKVFEEERKAREFHAKPPPKSILRSHNNQNECGAARSTKSCAQEQDGPVAFKAKPASVLLKKPFEPKHEEHIIEVEAFNFATDQRLEARHQFDLQVKEMEQMREQHEKEQEELKKKDEEEEVARLRKEAEHKAQPVKKYTEVVIRPSNKITRPISPKFHCSNRNRNKENVEN